MFGESLLVAPVVTKDAREWSVYLPAGETWLDVGSIFKVCLHMSYPKAKENLIYIFIVV